MTRRRHSVISLFSGAMGLDLGLEASGFDVRVAVECNSAALKTIRANRPELPVIDQKIEDVTTAEILRAAGLKRGEATVVTGGPSCQPFSTAGRRGSVGDPRGKLFHEFCRVVREARPRFFIMENVPGMLSAAVAHRPLKERGVGFPPLKPEEQLGSALLDVLKELRTLGYHIVFGVLNAADYGTPQTRQRVLFLGSRDNEPLAMPERTHDAVGDHGRAPWRTLVEALAGLDPALAVGGVFPESKRRLLSLVPEGGNWRDLPLELQREALGAAYDSWGGRVGFCRRLSFSRPSPSLTTVPDGRATMFCHPTELRPHGPEQIGHCLGHCVLGALRSELLPLRLHSPGQPVEISAPMQTCHHLVGLAGTRRRVRLGELVVLDRHAPVPLSFHAQHPRGSAHKGE